MINFSCKCMKYFEFVCRSRERISEDSNILVTTFCLFVNGTSPFKSTCEKCICDDSEKGVFCRWGPAFNVTGWTDTVAPFLLIDKVSTVVSFVLKYWWWFPPILSTLPLFFISVPDIKRGGGAFLILDSTS